MGAEPSVNAGCGRMVVASPELRSVVLQFGGSAATLLAALWVSWRLGLAAQGEFGLAKSWFDAAAGIAALGLPQGILHLQYRLKIPAAALKRWLALGGSGLAAAASAMACLLWSVEQRLSALVLMSLPFAVGHLLSRSVLLAQRGPAVFGAVTAMPASLLLAGVLVFGIIGSASGFDALLLASATLSGVVSMTLAWRSAGPPQSMDWPHAELWRVSLQSWVQAALGGLLAASMLSVVAWTGRGQAELGKASLGLHLYQFFVVISGYVAPLLFARLARQDHPQMSDWPPLARRVAGAILLLAVLGLAASRIEPDWGPWLLPLSLMLPAGVAAVAARVAGTVLLAKSAYSELSLQAAWRLAAAFCLTALGLRWLAAASALALALLLVETATWWRSTVLARQGPR